MLLSTLVTLCFTLAVTASRLSLCEDKQRSKLVAQYFEAYNDWSVNSIPWRYTDIAFYFQGSTTKSGFQADEYKTTFKQFVEAAHASDTLAIYTIGGWGASDYFSSLAATKASRTKFADEIVAFLNKHNFDGVDFDWEYPNRETSCTQEYNKDDTANFLSLLKIVRQKIGSGKYITAAVTPSGLLDASGEPLKDASAFGDVLDFLIIMNYDTFGPGWSETTGPNAPLYSTCSDVKSSAGDGLAYWSEAGFPACKMLLGAPGYSHAWITKSSKLEKQIIAGHQTQLYQPATAIIPQAGPNDKNATSTSCGVTTTSFSGIWNFKQMIKEGLLSADGLGAGNRGFKRYWDSCSSTPFLFNAKKKQMIPYDDEISLGLKAEFAKKKGMAGLAIFSSGQLTERILKHLTKAKAVKV